MNAAQPIRVLVVDDSTFMRHVLRRMLEGTGDIVVAGEARDGDECIELTRALRPDVVTLDVRMRRMSGLDALRAIADGSPKAPAVIMVSSLTTRDAHTTLEALELGAVDFIAKPSFESTAAEIVALGTEVVEKVRAHAHRRRDDRATPRRVTERAPVPPGRLRIECVGIGTSTGGPVALSRVLPALPREFPAPIVIAQHMPPGFTAALSERLDAACALDVREARGGMRLAPGCAVFVPAGSDARAVRGERGVRIVLERSSARTLSPSVDVLFTSLARSYGSAAGAVVLTGMGHDGVEGLRAVRDVGGFTAGQDEQSCAVFGMPRAAARAGVLDCIVALDELPRLLCEVTGLGVPLQRQEGSRPPPPGT